MMLAKICTALPILLSLMQHICKPRTGKKHQNIITLFAKENYVQYNNRRVTSHIKNKIKKF